MTLSLKPVMTETIWNTIIAFAKMSLPFGNIDLMKDALVVMKENTNEKDSFKQKNN